MRSSYPEGKKKSNIARKRKACYAVFKEHIRKNNTKGYDDMAKKVGTLIKEARTAAGLTQEQLARKIKGLSAAELGKAESGEVELTQAFLKEIAKATGVTQASLLTAAKASTAKKTTTAKKTETAKKTTAAKKTETAKKTTAAKKTTTAKKTTDLELTAAEKKLIEAYRAASADAKKNALKLLKGEDLEFADIMKLLKLDSKLDSLGSGDGILGGLKEGLLGGLLGKK